MVNDFAAHNFLGQNIQQCEIVMFSHGRGTGMTPHCEVDGSEIPVRSTSVVKCLRYWWRGDLMATCSVEGKHQEGSQVCFHYGRLGSLHQGLWCGSWAS